MSCLNFHYNTVRTVHVLHTMNNNNKGIRKSSLWIITHVTFEIAFEIAFEALDTTIVS